MELRYLLSFVTVVECSGFTRAADRLRLTQAGVSKHIAALEAEIGAPLLERSGRRVRLTATGSRLYPRARKILELLDEARRDVGLPATVVEGPLRIAASTVPAQSLVPQLVAEFHELHPQVRELVTVSDSAMAIRAVEQGNSDVGIVGELPGSSQLQSRPIADDELLLVVSPRHPLGKSRRITPQRLKSESLIVREGGSGSRQCVERALDAVGLSLAEMTVAMEMNSNEAIRGAVERGAGAAFLSRVIVAEAVAERRLLPINVSGLRVRRHLFLVTNASRVLPAAGRAFVEFADQWARHRKRGHT